MSAPAAIRQRLTKSEAAYVLGHSYRKLSQKMIKLGLVTGRYGLLDATTITMLGIDTAMVDAAIARAVATDLEAVRAACATCSRNPKPCNEHAGILSFKEAQW